MTVSDASFWTTMPPGGDPWVMIKNTIMGDPVAEEAMRVLGQRGHLMIMPKPVTIEFSPEAEQWIQDHKP